MAFTTTAHACLRCAEPAGMRAGPGLESDSCCGYCAARQGGAALRAVFVIRTMSLAAALAAGGCAHNKANQYSYAPPLAPAVYPQPQTVGQPIASPAGPPGAVPMGAPPVYLPPGGAALPPPPGMPVLPTSAEMSALPDGSCPPCHTGGGVVPVVYEGAVQTTPCPPGP